MRIRLLNDGGYPGMENVEFPVGVEAERRQHRPHPLVPSDEMERIGCHMSVFDDIEDPFWPFSVEYGECEVIEE